MGGRVRRTGSQRTLAVLQLQLSKLNNLVKFPKCLDVSVIQLLHLICTQRNYLFLLLHFYILSLFSRSVRLVLSLVPYAKTTFAKYENDMFLAPI